jgi:hypothetical protein
MIEKSNLKLVDATMGKGPGSSEEICRNEPM